MEKQFWKMSEFWVLMLTALFDAVLPMLEVFKDHTWAAVLINVVGVVYALIRTFTKFSREKKTPSPPPA